MLYVIMLIVLMLFAYLAFKYYISSLILSAWIIEKEYAPPTQEDTKRLAKWVVQKILNKKN